MKKRLIKQSTRDKLPEKKFWHVNVKSRRMQKVLSRFFAANGVTIYRKDNIIFGPYEERPKMLAAYKRYVIEKAQKEK